MADNPVDWVKAHPKAAAAVVGVAGLGAFGYWLLTRNQSSSATSGLTPQQYVLSPTTGASTVTGGQSGGASTVTGGQSGTNPFAGVNPGGLFIKGTCSNGGVLAALCPKTTVPPASSPPPNSTPNPALVKLNTAYVGFLANHVGGTSQQFAQDLNAAAGITPLTPAEALNLNYEHWLVSHPGGTSAQFGAQLRAAAAAKAA